MKVTIEQLNNTIANVCALVQGWNLTDWQITVNCSDCNSTGGAFMTASYDNEHANITINSHHYLTEEYNTLEDLEKDILSAFVHEVFHVRMRPYHALLGISGDNRSMLAERECYGVQRVAWKLYEFMKSKNNEK